MIITISVRDADFQTAPPKQTHLEALKYLQFLPQTKKSKNTSKMY